MEDDEMLDLLRTAYAEVKQRDADFSADSSLRDELDVDSLDSIDILSIIEEQTGMRVDESALESLGGDATVNDFVALLQQNAKPAAM